MFLFIDRNTYSIDHLVPKLVQIPFFTIYNSEIVRGNLVRAMELRFPTNLDVQDDVDF